MNQRIKDAAERAGRYATFAELFTQSIMAERKLFGWVDSGPGSSHFYEVWPGGRCIDWTSILNDQ